MRPAALLLALALALLSLPACSSMDDGDEPWTSAGGGAPEPDPEDVPGTLVCSSPGDANDLRLLAECSPGSTVCEIGDYLGANRLAASVCCAGDWSGAQCVAVLPVYCGGGPSECPDGSWSKGECPDGMVEICDF